MRKLHSLLLAILLLAVFATNIYSQGGPIQPEVTKFEPVDITDMVNLTTGDFVYSLPLLEVPGPEGDYPISIFYNAGINPNQEPSWVGLGWNINPGAIIRSVNGYPDDFLGEIIETHYEAYKYDTGFSIGFGIQGFGMSLQFSSSKGFSGASISASIPITENAGIGVSVGSGGVSGGLSYQGQTSNGVGVRAGLGYSSGGGMNMSGGLTATQDHMDIETKTLQTSHYGDVCGFSLSSKSGGNTSIAGVGLSASSSVGDGSFSSGSASLPPIPGVPITLGFWGWHWRLNQTEDDYAYGYINEEAFINNYDGTPDSHIKFDRNKNESIIFSSQDSYNINVQGLNGAFQPFYDAPYIIGDDINNEAVLSIYQTINSTLYSFLGYERDLTFRMINDPGSNLITIEDLNSNPAWGDNFLRFEDQNNPEIVDYYKDIKSSTIIEHVYIDGEIVGFKVTNNEGTVYEFMQPVKTYKNYTKSLDLEDDTKSAYTYIHSGYATSWLITAIKGPDYYDYNNDNNLDESDWGYWVKFNYDVYDESGKHNIIPFRTPSQGYSPEPDGGTGQVVNYGVRDNIYLNSVETATHVAVFNTEDDLAIKGISEPYWLEKETIEWANNQTYTCIEVPGDWRELFDGRTRNSNYIIFKFKLYELSSGYYDKYVKIDDMIQQVYYNDQTKKSTFVIDGSKLTLSRSSIREQKFYISNILADIKGTRKKLDKISLFKKNSKSITNNETYGTWTQNLPDSSIKNVEFDYNTSLCNGYYQDDIHPGKLTLTEIKYKGTDNFDYGLPSYKFGYVNNFDYNQDGWDRWGNYRVAGTFNDKHLTPQVQSEADNASAWSLSSIQTPTGGIINIDYEADDYYRVNNTFDFMYSHIGYTNQNNTSNILPITNAPENFADIYTIGKIVYIFEELTSSDPEDDRGNRYFLGSSQIVNNENYTLTLADNFEFKQNDNNFNYDYEIYIAQNVFGGGIRVKSLTRSNGDQNYITKYSYTLEDNVTSSGVSASLPPQYCNKLIGFIEFFQENDVNYSLRNDYEKCYLDHEESYGRPGPGVIYSRVEVENFSLSDVSEYGKSVYSFYTSNDYPHSYTSNTNQIKVINKSAIYGKPIKVELYNSDGKLVKLDEFDYTFSNLINIDGKKAFSTSTVNNPLGLIQEKYISMDQDSDDPFKFIDNQIYQVYAKGISSQIFTYPNNIKQTFVTENKNILWDARTGSGLASATKDSKQNTIISYSEPAYWHYGEMIDKNMITQNAVQSKYLNSSLSFSNDYSLTTYIQNIASQGTDVISSIITTWEDDWGTGTPKIWRKNDSYNFVGDGNYSEFTQWTADDPGDYVNNIWKRTSNITKYDRYSHPVEEKHIDGTYTSSIYGYDDALPIAIAKNAKSDEWAYVGFENSEMFGWNQSEQVINNKDLAHNGEYCIKFNTDFSSTKDFFFSDLVQGRNYSVSVWVKGSNATTLVLSPNNIGGKTVNAQGTGEWELLSLEYTAEELSEYFVNNSNFLRVYVRNYNSTDVYVDDFRFYPTDASISTYTYNSLTHKVTSITDDNNKTAYFEYDAAGRLVKVLDQDKNILSKHQYKHITN